MENYLRTSSSRHCPQVAGLVNLIFCSAQGALEDRELMLMLDSLFESMTGSGFLSEAEKVLK